MHMRDSGRADLKPERIALLLSGEQAIETAPEDGVRGASYGTATAARPARAAIEDAATGRAARFRWLVVYVRDGADWRVALEPGEPDRRAAVSAPEVTATTRARTFCRGRMA